MGRRSETVSGGGMGIDGLRRRRRRGGADDVELDLGEQRKGDEADLGVEGSWWDGVGRKEVD